MPTRIKQGWQNLREYWKEQAVPRWRRFAGRHPRRSRIVRWIGLSAGGVLLLVLIVWWSILLSVPTTAQLRKVRTQVASDIYTADSVLLGRYYNQYRTVVSFDEIPSHVIEALVATEDERFFAHRGIDYRSWGRVFVRTILQGDESGGGGSTISQQLAKNLFGRGNYWLFSLPINKLREIAIARRLERAYTKEEILAMYLNTVAFPENVYGIDIASRRFFGRPPAELQPEEGAMLIGTLRATTYYNPARYPDRAQQRRNVVLAQMERNGYLTPETVDSLQALPLELHYDPVISNQDLAPYFLAFVRQEVQGILSRVTKDDGEPYDLFTDGLRVYTTLHSVMQRHAEAAVTEHLSDMQRRFDDHWRNRTAPWNDVETIRRAVRTSPRYQVLLEKGRTEEQIFTEFEKEVPMKVFSWDGVQEATMSPLDSVRYHLGMLQVGFMALEPYTGNIRAWVGGINFDYFQYDHVRARRQAGSVFKPVVYTEALLAGVDPCEQVPSQLLVYHEYAKGDWAVKDPSRDDPEPHFDPDGTDKDDWIPQNADGKYGGSYSMRGALTNSVNTVSVEMIMRTGVMPVVKLARQMGITSDIPVEPSIALGTAEVSLYEMITPFAILASRGRQVRPVSISRIETHDGRILFDANLVELYPSRAIDTTYADLMTAMLESVANYGTASRLRWKYGLYNMAIAGKTGTSQNHSDGWFIGYTPRLVAGAWVGGDSPLVRFRNFENGQGAATALPVVALFLRRLTRDPSLAGWQGGEFAPLSPDLRTIINCPMRIPSPEELLADSLAADSLRALELESLPTLLPLPDSLQNQ